MPAKRPRQTEQTPIRLLLKKQSDQVLLCLLFWHAFGEFQFWLPTLTHEEMDVIWIKTISLESLYKVLDILTLYLPVWGSSFFLLILARSNFDHYARECNFGILKKKQKQNKKKQKRQLGASLSYFVFGGSFQDLSCIKASKCWIRQIMMASQNYFKVIHSDHLNLKLLAFCRQTASINIWISKVQDFLKFWTLMLCRLIWSSWLAVWSLNW